MSVSSSFALEYYNDPSTWRATYWLGVPTAKCPLDLWIYQEILTETRPDLIVETGTHMGGSALFLASVCDQLGNGSVLTIDIVDRSDRPQHPRITYVSGSSTDPDVVAQIGHRVRLAERVMVILDSDHSEAHVFDELSQLGPMVSPDCYLIVEDTNVNGHPVEPGFGPGPAEALERYLDIAPPRFIVDRSREKLLLTFNPGGYLRRMGP